MIKSWSNSATKTIGTPVKRLAKEQYGSEGISDYFGFPTQYPYLLTRLKNKNQIIEALSSKVVTDFSHMNSDAQWKLTAGLETRHLVPPGPNGQWNVPDPIWYQLDDDGAWFARAGRSISNNTNTYWVGLWKKGSSSPYLTYKGKHKWKVEVITISKDGKRVASSDKFGQVHVWDAQTGKQIRVFDSAKNEQIWNVKWHPDGSGVYYSSKPYTGKAYAANHYGGLNKFFNLRYRYIADEQTPDDNQRLARQGDDLETLVIEHNDLKVAFDEPAFGKPSAQEFIRGAFNGVKNLVALGSESGKMVVVEILSNNKYRIRRWFQGHHSMVTSISQSPDGKLLASSSIDGTIRFWDLNGLDRFSGDIDFKFRGNQVLGFEPDSETAKRGIQLTDNILRFGDTSFYESRKYQIEGKYKPGDKVKMQMLRRDGSGAYNVEYQLQPSATHVEPLASLLVTKAPQGSNEVEEWVIWSPRGYYDASGNGDKYIGWHVNGRDRSTPAQFFKAKQFSKELYRPAVIDKIFETQNTEIALQSVTEDFDLPSDYRDAERLGEITPPEVKIVAPIRDGWEIPFNKIDVVANVTAANSKVTDVVFEVNGLREVAKGKTKGIGLRKKPGEKQIFRQKIQLKPGRNTITVTAYTRDSESAPSTVTVICNPKKEATNLLGDLYVIAIGVSDYEHEDISDLSYADKDAEDFVRICRSQEGKLFNKVNVRLLTNEKATTGNIADAIDDLLLDKPGRDDCVMILYSGHGVFDPSGQYYFAAHDSIPNRLGRSAVAQERIEKLVNVNLSHCHRILFMDACHSGAVTSSGIRSADPWRDCGGVVFASSVWRETSLELTGEKNGVLVKALLEAAIVPSEEIDHAIGVIEDEFVSAKELDSYFHKRIPKLTNGKQHASSEWPSNLIDFPVFKRIEVDEE